MIPHGLLMLISKYIHIYGSRMPDKKLVFFLNWDSLHTRLNNHYEAWSYKKRNTKRLKHTGNSMQHTGNLFRKNLQLKDVC